MDAFERLVGLLLQQDGYWVQTSLKVNLTAEEKRKIGRPSSPRWELDVVGYRAATNEVLAVECKSYLDSTGVVYRNGSFEPDQRYKLFSDPTLRRVVLARLETQLVQSGYCRPKPRIRLGLATGKMANTTDREALRERFEREGWFLLDDNTIRQKLARTARSRYENDEILVTSKILLRGDRS